MTHENNRLRPNMIDTLNIILAESGSCLRYKIKSKTCNIVNYQLIVEDKFIDNTYSSAINYSKNFERQVRNFFREFFDIESLGYENSVQMLVAYEDGYKKEESEDNNSAIKFLECEVEGERTTKRGNKANELEFIKLDF